MRLAEFFIVLSVSLFLTWLIFGDSKTAKNIEPGQEIKIFMDGIKYGKDPRRGVCYAINPNYGYVFTYIPCEIQK